MNEIQLKELILSNNEYLEINKTLFEMYNDNITKYIKKAIQSETKTENALQEVYARLNTTNIIKKVVNKLATSYNNKTMRKVYLKEENKRIKYQEIVESIEEIYDIDYTMSLCDILLNLNYTVLLQIKEDELKIIPAHLFISNDKELVIFDADNIEVYTETNRFVYTKEYKLVSQEEASLQDFIIINKNLFLNKPFANTDDLHMALLLPLLLTDMNFALRFQSHSIIYGVNIKAENLAMTPNSFWAFESSANETVQLGTIEPKVDVDKMLSAIEQQFVLWLETKNIKIQSFENKGLSGIAKAIDNSSIDEQVQSNQKIFKRIEAILWRKLYNKLNINEEGLPNILFLNKENVLTTTTETIDNNIKLLNNNLKTKKQVLEELNSEKTNEEIEALLIELDSTTKKGISIDNNNYNSNIVDDNISDINSVDDTSLAGK